MTSFLLKTFLNLFIVIDPIGLAPIFITLAGNLTLPEQFGIARRAVLVSGGILLAFALGGNLLLDYLGIGIEAFQVATGILLFKIAVDMVFAQRERETEEEAQEAQAREDISVFPLAIPLIAGPGTLASILTLQSESEAYEWGWLIIFGIASVVLLITYLLLCFSRYLANFLGKTGVNVITRVLGIILSALAMQYITDGAVVILKGVVNS
ncbi:MAG: MarC family protein [Hydrococcus sp. RU_2_2]|nr:MarC family protein [Hydrococcus sp. RU_2_2]NJP17582.1 MarC family protein [Hydrococcus sp. CRU_1_1]